MKKKNHRLFTLIVLGGGAVLVYFNETCVAPAMPIIMAGLNIDEATVSLLTSGYAMANAIMIPITAFLLDKYSEKRLFIIAAFIFLIGSTLAFFCFDFYTLLFGRIIQGIGAGITMPVGMTMFMLAFPPEKRGLALGIWGIAIGSGPLFGPILGGLIVDAFPFNCIFLMDIPLALLVFTLAFFIDSKRVNKNSDAKLHIPSLIECVLSLGFLLYGLSMVGSHGPEPLYLIFIVLGVVILIIFGRTQLKLTRPMLRIDVLKNRQFLLGNILVMILNASLLATASLLPMYLEDVLNQPAIVQAFVQLPGSALLIWLNPFAGNYQDKHGTGKIIIFGFIFMSIATLCFSFLSLSSSLIYVTVIYFVRMMGLGCANMPANNWALQTLDDEVLNHGTSINNTLRQISASLSIAIVMSIANLSTTEIYEFLNIDFIHADLIGLDLGYLFCMVLAITGLIMSLIIFRKKKKK